ncbi:MAG: hypothetical protein IPK85_16455 [Gemmatimonadetes bacterium]|nr:hypothetical protein [Gemmatimonadota bacterium]
MLKKDYPDHHDADLVLKLYEMRREAVMRASRASINADFWPKSWEDVQAVTKQDHPLNAAWRQVGTYWEMVYGMAKHGVVHPDFMMESCGEGIFLFARIEPYLAQIREINPFAFRNAEWVVTNSDRGKALLELFRKRVQTILAARS